MVITPIKKNENNKVFFGNFHPINTDSIFIKQMQVKKHWLHRDNTYSIFFYTLLHLLSPVFSLRHKGSNCRTKDITNHTPSKHVLYKTPPLPLSDLGSTFGPISNVPPTDWSPESSLSLLTWLPECVSDRACRARNGTNINRTAVCDVSCHLGKEGNQFSFRYWGGLTKAKNNSGTALTAQTGAFYLNPVRMRMKWWTLSHHILNSMWTMCLKQRRLEYFLIINLKFPNNWKSVARQLLFILIIWNYCRKKKTTEMYL